MTQVQIISAPWCKRCLTLKPSADAHCKILGITPTWLNYDDFEEDNSLKAQVQSLPTFMVRPSETAEWQMFAADAFEKWKAAVTNMTTVVVKDLDF